jgi:hypothetical protein
LEAEKGGLFVEACEQVLAVFVLVVMLADVGVIFAFPEHPVDEPRDFVCQRFDRLSCVKPGAQPPAEGSVGYSGG